MALSNIKREPRREWTEQAAGALAVLAWLASCRFIAYPWAVSIAPVYDHRPDYGTIWFVTIAASVGLAVAPLLVILAWYLVHDIGEAVCGLAAAMGFDPRPKNRYR